jgi:hypothetical protein
MFSTRLVQKPSSAPTPLSARPSFGYQDNLPVQYMNCDHQFVRDIHRDLLLTVGYILCLFTRNLPLLCTESLLNDRILKKGGHAPVCKCSVRQCDTRGVSRQGGVL